MKVNPIFNNNNRVITYDDVKQFVNKMRTEWKVNYYHELFITNRKRVTKKQRYASNSNISFSYFTFYVADVEHK